MQKYGIGLYATYIGKGKYIYGHKIISYEENSSLPKDRLLYEMTMNSTCETYRDDELIDLLDTHTTYKGYHYNNRTDYTALDTKHFKIVAVAKESNTYKMIEKEFFHHTFFEALRLKVMLRGLAIDMLEENQELVDYIVLGY